MTSFIEQLDQILHRTGSVCLAMLVDVQGSMPQKPGITMLIFPDGTTSGSIGGGSTEAEIIRAGQAQLHSSATGGNEFPRARFVSLARKSAADDAGMSCGDRMTVLLETIHPGDDVTYFQQLRTSLSNSKGVTEVVVWGEHSSHGTPTDRYLFDDAGQSLASRRDQQWSNERTIDELRNSLKPLSTRPTSYTANGVLYVPRLKPIRLLMVGAGHVSQKVAELACDVDFDVWVVDDRPEYCQAAHFPSAQRLILSTIDEAMPSLAINNNTYCLILNRTHERDEQTLRLFIRSPAAYVGMIGSRRKIAKIFDDLMVEGVTQPELQNVHAPVGINIGSRSISEIAISIVAELIAHRNLGAVPNRRTIFESEPTVSD